MLLSAVQIFVFHILSMIHVYPLKDHYKLTKGLAPSGFDSVAQLVEQCTGITEVMDSIPVFHILSTTTFISLINKPSFSSSLASVRSKCCFVLCPGAG